MKEADKKELIARLERIEKLAESDKNGRRALYSMIMKFGMPWFKIEEDIPELGWEKGDSVDLRIERMDLQREERDKLFFCYYQGAGVVGKKNNHYFLFIIKEPMFMKITEEETKGHPFLPDNWEKFVEVVKKGETGERSR